MTNKGKKGSDKNQAVAPVQGTSTAVKSRDHRSMVLIAWILLATLLVHSNTLKNGFVSWDDDDYVYNNQDIRQLDSRSIFKFLTTYYLKMYQPVTMISYAIDYKIGKLNPSVYHGTNLVLHLLNVLLVFYLILMLRGQIAIAAIAALLFGVHPLHVESVAWISERKDLLYSFFYLGSLITYVFYRKKNNLRKYYALTIGLFLLSLLSKSAAVTLPAVLILIDYYLGKRLTFSHHLNKIPFFLLSFVFGIVSLLSQRVIGSDLDFVTDYTLMDRLLIGAYAFAFYLIKSILPFGLSALHPMPLKPGGMLPVKYFVSALFILGFLWLLVRLFKLKMDETLRRDILFGLLFFSFTIGLILFIPVGQAVVAERYTYIPYIGLFVILGSFYLYAKQTITPRLFRHGHWYAAVIALFMAFCAFAAYARNAVWKDTITLFSNVIERHPESGIAYNNRGNARREHNDFAGALEDYNKAIELNYQAAFNNRGILRNRMGDYKKAIEDFDKASDMKADREKVFYNRGIAKLNLGDYRGAAEDFSRAIEINPQYSSAYNNRGLVRYEKLSEFKNAVSDFDVAIRLNSMEPELFYNRGNAKMHADDFTGAVADYDRALDIKPDYAEACFNKGVALLKMKQTDRACQSWQKALELGAKPAAELFQIHCR